MNGNTATLRIREDQPVVVPMEARIARIESDVGHIKVTLRAQAEAIKELRGDMKAANESIAGLKIGLGELRGEVGVLRAEMRAEIGTVRAEMGELRAELKGDISTLWRETKALVHALETTMVKWVVGTVLATGGLVFSIGRFLL